MGLPLAFASLSRLWGGADHRPFAFDLVETSDQELSKASGAFDLTENGFDDLLAQSVAAASPGAFELEGPFRGARSTNPESRATTSRFRIGPRRGPSKMTAK